MTIAISPQSRQKQHKEIFKNKYGIFSCLFAIHLWRYCKIFLFLFFVFEISKAWGGEVLYSNDRLNYQIIVPIKPSKVETFAGKELNRFLKRSYTKPIITNGKAEKITFMIGLPSEAILAGFSGIKFASNGFGIFRKKNNFVFCGYNKKDVDPENTMYYSTGTLSAVYYFLNKYVGVDFYFPGENGFSLKYDKEINFKLEKDVPKPTFELRGFYTCTKEYSTKEMNIFSRRMLCNIPSWCTPEIYYTFGNSWKKRFWKKHSDYFILRDGKRICERYPWHVPCLSNPDVIHRTAADIIEEINLNPSKRTVRIFCDAPINQCHCSSCNASRERRYCGKDENVGEEVYGFINKVISLVRQAHPKTCILAQTKGKSYYEPPVMFKIKPFWITQILTGYPLYNVNYSNYVKLAEKWNKAGAITVLKSYPRYPMFKNYPVMNTRLRQKYLRYFEGIVKGTIHSDLCNNTPYAFCAFNQYAQAKMLFDVNIDLNVLTEKFCKFAYPGAVKEMIQFHSIMEDIFHSYQVHGGNIYVRAYHSDKLAQALNQLETASGKIKKQIFFPPLYQNFKKFYQGIANQQTGKTDKQIIISGTNKKIDYLLVSLNNWDKAFCENLQPIKNKKYRNFQKGKVCIVRDTENLYIGLIAFEEHVDMLLQKCRRNHVGPLWSDDCFEIMLVNNLAESEYYQIIVNIVIYNKCCYAAS